MDTLNKNTSDFVDEICCDEPNYLIWKWHPAGPQQGADPRGNAIRWDSSLRVRDGEVAVFVYHQQDGIYQDFIEGPCDQVLKTANLPVLREISGPADDDAPFQAEVYFINLVQAVEVRFGEPFFDVYDPRLDLSVPVTTRGAINFGVGTIAGSSSSTDSTSSTSTTSRFRFATPSRATRRRRSPTPPRTSTSRSPRSRAASTRSMMPWGPRSQSASRAASASRYPSCASIRSSST